MPQQKGLGLNFWKGFPVAACDSVRGDRWRLELGIVRRVYQVWIQAAHSSLVSPYNLHLHHSPHSSRSIQFRWMWNKKIFCCRRIIRWKIISMLYISFNDVVCKARGDRADDSSHVWELRKCLKLCLMDSEHHWECLIVIVRRAVKHHWHWHCATWYWELLTAAAGPRSDWN